MDPDVVPREVENAFARLGFRATSRISPDRWLATALDGSADGVELWAMGADVHDDALVARVARLRGVRHDHLSVLLDATELSDGRVGLVVEHVEGLSLAQIRAARSPLSDGEGATVAIPVAGALGALHDAGLVHGAVDASTILVRPDGRPVLVDLRAAVLGTAEPGDDLAALVDAVVAQLPGDEVHLLAGGLFLRDALVEALGRPAIDAAGLAEACFGAAEPEPVQLPDAGSLASSALVSNARSTPPAPTRRSVRRRSRGRVVALVGVGALVLGIGGWRIWSAPEASALTDAHDPVAAAVELSRLRASAVGAADLDRLADVEVAEGPAHAVDSTLLAAVDPARTQGLRIDVRDAWLVPDDGSRASTTDVAVTAAMATAAGAGTPRTVVLGLRWTDDGWRVWDVVRAAG